METWLHLANPWILITATAMLVAAAIEDSIPATLPLLVGATLLRYRPYRTWIAAQLYLALVAVRNLWRKELAWRKSEKTTQNLLRITNGCFIS